VMVRECKEGEVYTSDWKDQCKKCP
jgi:rRNA maturation protein Nop10